MTKLTKNKLQNIEGGSNNISGTVINAFTNVIRLLLESGQDFGSSLRRITDNKICPLE